MVSSNASELIKRARSHVHRLSGLLTGISAGLYCGKMAADLQSATPHIQDSQQLTQEADKELAEIRALLRELDQITE